MVIVDFICQSCECPGTIYIIYIASKPAHNFILLKILFDFTHRAFNQISLKVVQVIYIITYGGPGSWSQGAEVGTGKLGFSPIDYAQLLSNGEKGEKQAASPPAPFPLVLVVANIKTIEKLTEKKAVNDQQ